MLNSTQLLVGSSQSLSKIDGFVFSFFFLPLGIKTDPPGN
jgi:hypothetical protein